MSRRQPFACIQQLVRVLLDSVLTYLGILLNAHLARMDERGASAVEYGLLVAAVAMMLVLAAKGLGLTFTSVFNTENTKLSNPPVSAAN